MLKKSLFLILSLTVIFAIGCSKDSTSPGETVNEFKLLTDMGDQYFSTYTTAAGLPVNVAISAVYPILMDADPANDPFIVDYRSAADFATGHIKNAVNISLAVLADKVEDGTIPTNKTILNVCYTGQTASYATSLLNMLGFEAQNLLFGMCGVTVDASIAGTQKWLTQIAADEFAAQLTSVETKATQANDFKALATGQKDGVSVLKARMKQILPAGWGQIAAADVFADPGKYFIVNYWPLAEYTTPGHIPGAVCFEPKNAFKADQMLKYLPFDKTIVIYCYTGQTSAQVVAYLQALGYDAKSLLFGMNGFAYNSMTKSKYAAPADDYSAIIVK